MLYTRNYSYDYAGRLSLENTGELFPPRGKNFNYDARGNLSYVINYTSNISQTPTQNYHYDGDRLVSMDDVSLGHVLSSCSFTHDNLGRMTYDGLSDLQIEYNHLDLPRKVISDGTALVNYSYLADGTKTSSLKPTGEGLVYRGPFTYRKDADGTMELESAACPEGRLTPGKALLYVTNHLGSVRYVIDGNTGAQLENSDYTAYGTRSGSTPSAGTGLTFRDHFTGQEDQMPDFNIPYNDHGARHYNPALLRWMVPDPLSEKYYGQSPYNYCGGNPMSFVDLDGRELRPLGEDELKVIRNTLPEDARQFVQLDKNGNIDRNLLSNYSGTSNNFSSLVKLAESEKIVVFSISNKYECMMADGTVESGQLSYFEQDNELMDSNVEFVSGLSTGESGTYGKTLFPDKGGVQNSTSSNIEIYIHPSLSTLGKAEAFSHEGYGHALLYLQNNFDHHGASHKPKGMRDSNATLVNMILTARKETIKNMNK